MPNNQIIHDALGFMLGGDYGWNAVVQNEMMDVILHTYKISWG